jgi:hypothetical protein
MATKLSDKDKLDILLNKRPSQDTTVSLEDIQSLGSRESLLNAVGNIDRYSKMLKQRITLINEDLTAAIPFTCENLYLFCAYTGSGKSTAAANITYPLWKQGKKTLVISNEEPRHDILFRIASLELGLSFNAYKKGEMDKDDVKRVISLFEEISEYVHIMDVEYKDGLSTKVEGIKNALTSVKAADYSCVLIVKYSVENPSKKSYDNLNDLRIWLGQYIKSSTAPVVLFAQLYSIDKKGGVKGVEARLKECSAIVEPATVIIEICPDFDTQISEFLIHKDRFGRQGKKIVCGYENGLFVPITMDQLVEKQKNAKLKEQEEKIAMLVAKVKSDV